MPDEQKQGCNVSRFPVRPGMMLLVYGWRSFFQGLLDVEHQWARLVFGPLAVSTGLIIFYLLFLKKTKKDK